MSQRYRRRALRDLTAQIGVYALCDLDNIPIYVGQSIDGIRQRVNRHLTSARSDIIANRQIDVWKIAYVKAWPVENQADIPRLEAVLFKFFDDQKRLMNGSLPLLFAPMPADVPSPAQTVRVMSEEDIRIRREPALRLPRQIEHIGRLVDYVLTVKDAPHLRRSLAAHFERLDSYRADFLKEGIAADAEILKVEDLEL
ncbi:MAG TPA: GIY-YIG nuclease family protein [Stellaceae bacterium]|nr:GIY-YIG nuclease family protein [Stellaceae bacterium]